MKIKRFFGFLLFIVIMAFQISCLQSINKMRIYDKESGKKITLILTKQDNHRGTINTPQSNGDQIDAVFVGEYHTNSKNKKVNKEDKIFIKKANSMAEEYGFGKNSNAKPVGTGIIVGSKGTVIDIVFYNVQYNLESGEGIGRDNNGKYYRVYLSEEFE